MGLKLSPSSLVFGAKDMLPEWLSLALDLLSDSLVLELLLSNLLSNLP